MVAGSFCIMRIDINLFDTEEAIVKKAKWHYIEFAGPMFHYRANYLSEEKIEETPTECWRFWDEVHFKFAVTSFGVSRSLSVEEGKEWIWMYRISLYGMADDILIPFENQDSIQKFHEKFKNYMNV